MDSPPVNLCPRRTTHALALAVAVLLVSTFVVHGQITKRGDAVGKLLNEWHAQGKAAGLSAITYENRDGEHSLLNTSLYPQLKVFKPDAKSGPTKGPAGMLRLSPTVGNCSMAATAVQGGSLPRLYQMDPRGQTFLMMQYLANNLMIYPEHQDHDIGANGMGGYGDLFPTNSATCIISQGSSGSDQPFLQAVLSTIAAFSPQTQDTLIQKRLLMPTVQTILRRCYRMVKTESDYLTGAAHPVVFDAAQLDEEKMVRMAHEMTEAMIPPLVQLEVEEETKLAAGRDYFEDEKAHPYAMADTPVSITRLMRGNIAEYGMVISAKKMGDLKGRPLKILWKVLQGDPRAVRIDASGSGPYARIRVRWQPSFLNASGIRSHRVDVGVFATNGISVSTPAFISFYMLPNEMHFYDAEGRVAEVAYQAYNPDIGMPPDPADPRWLKLMLAMSIKGDGMRSELMEQLLTAEERTALQQSWVTLNKKWEAVQQLESQASQKDKDKAAALRRELAIDLKAALDATLPGERKLTARSAVEKSLSAIIGYADFYPSLQDKLDAQATRSSKGGAPADVKAQVHRLIDLGILIEEASGRVTTAKPPAEMTMAERYQLAGLNLTVASEVLFPDALIRSTAPAWVDPRLTTPKPWRDVHRYDQTTGKHLGWIRHHEGRRTWFDADGNLLPDGPDKPDHATPVKYQKNAQGDLEWLPQR